MSELDNVRKAVLRRKITRVYHFTQARALSHILGPVGGVASTSYLKDNHADIVSVTDAHRLDNRQSHISCSIQYPNVWYLKNAIRREHTFEDWVLLIIDPSVLWRPNTLFSPVNSATAHGSHLKQGLEAFEIMYADESIGNRKYQRTQNMPDCYPTDGQAEAMIYNFIELDCVSGVVAKTTEDTEHIIGQLRYLKISSEVISKLNWLVSEELFSTDHIVRNRIVKHGIVPKESSYQI